VRREPDSRWRATRASAEEPSHPVEAEYWRHFKELERSATMERCAEIYNEQYERECFQPWILAGVSDQGIWERLRISTDVTKAYRHLFFDATAFRDEIEKRLWVAKYSGSKEGKSLLQLAVVQDVEAVAYAMGMPANVDMSRVMDAAVKEQFFRGMSLRYARLGSPEASTCSNMLKGAAAHAAEIMTNKPASSADELFKLVTRDLTKSVEDTIPHGEILH
jgi:hypothetical protein